MTRHRETADARVVTSDLEPGWNAVAAAWEARAEHIEEQAAGPTAALLSRAAPRDGDRVLELAAGPGRLGPTLSALVGPEGAVVVSDLAPAMVQAASRRNEPFPNVDVDVIDVSAIARPDASFDVVICRMGLMFAPAPAAALTEIHRVLRPGGRFAALTWAGMEHNPWMTCVALALSAHGLMAGGPPIGPGQVFSLGDASTLRSSVDDAGFADVGLEPHELVFRAPSIRDHIEEITALAGPLAIAVASATAQQLAAVIDTATRLAARHVTDDGVVIPGRALLVWGDKPSLDRRSPSFGDVSVGSVPDHRSGDHATTRRHQ